MAAAESKTPLLAVLYDDYLRCDQVSAASVCSLRVRVVYRRRNWEDLSGKLGAGFKIEAGVVCDEALRRARALHGKFFPGGPPPGRCAAIADGAQGWR